MKYIRTKDGIYRVLQYGSAKKHYVVISVVGLGHKVIDTSEIIKTADTIEELCTEFVMTQYFHETNLTFGKVLTKENKELFIKSVKLRKQDKDYDPNEFNIYGAIWTDKGLIYVAKMNDKGELELL